MKQVRCVFIRNQYCLNNFRTTLVYAHFVYMTLIIDSKPNKIYKPFEMRCLK